MGKWYNIKDELPPVREAIGVKLKNGCYDWGYLEEHDNELYFTSVFKHRHYSLNKISKWWRDNNG